MKLKSKLQMSISKRSGHVVLRRELAALGGASQLSEALNGLVSEGRLVRLAPGVFAKAHRATGGCICLDARPEVLTLEASGKLGRAVVVREVGQAGDAPVMSLEIGTELGASRPARRKPPGVRSVPGARMNGTVVLPQDVSQLPTSGVRQFIQGLAATHGVVHQRSGLDVFADAITRLAGDETRLDATGRLLVELKKRRIINSQQLARLTTNYMAEVKHVRSVQGLRGPGLPAQH